jgi:hypothetical protein
MGINSRSGSRSLLRRTPDGCSGALRQDPPARQPLRFDVRRAAQAADNTGQQRRAIDKDMMMLLYSVRQS